MYELYKKRIEALELPFNNTSIEEG